VYIRISQFPALPHNEPLLKPIEASSPIDWEAVKQRLHFCETHHKCSDDVRDPASLPEFRVIDCTTRQIISKHVGYKYTALSYVWGAETSPIVGSHVPTPAPTLIEDAIACTLAMGFQYLWIDRYCIDQMSSKKHIQIQNMDMIYAGAAMTIINAAGEGANCRLPGVSPGSYTETMPSIVTRGYTFQLLPQSQKEILSSKWSTRGWTYQEGYLARRRLVFTRTHIYMQCSESIYCDHALLHGSNGRLVPPPLSQSRDWLPIVFSPIQYSEFDILVNDYLRRELSDEADRLNAIMGIFRTLGHQVWGVSFPASSNCTQSFLRSLLWDPVEQSGRDLVVTRRPGFPSWSWAGWQNLMIATQHQLKNPGTGLLIFEVSDTSEMDFNMDVAIMDESKRMLQIEQCVRRMEEGFDMYRLHPRLHVYGWLTHLQLFPLSDDKKLHTESFVKFKTIKSPRHSFSLARPVMLMAQSLLAAGFSDTNAVCERRWPVLLFVSDACSAEQMPHSDSTDTTSTVPAGLVLKQMKGNSYERVGLVEFFSYSLVYFSRPAEPLGTVGSVVWKYENEGESMEWKFECTKCSIELV
jgi:hypothetical protein